MKCSICNAENPPDATSCQKCGFTLSFSQPAWPDFPSVEIPEPATPPAWSTLIGPQVELPSTLPQPVWPELEDGVSTTPVVEEIEVDAAIEPAPPPSGGVAPEVPHVDEANDYDSSVEEGVTVQVSPLSYPSDDELARTHVARGFEAIRAGLIDQARWEFEQARDLADSTDIVRLARAQLSELLPRQATPAAQEPARPIVEPSSRLAPSKTSPIDWRPTVRIGAIMGVVNGACTACTAPFCLGFLLSPCLGFLAGLLVARNKANPMPQPTDVIHAIAAGGITGLGGWLGQAISYPIWATSILDTLDVRSDSVTLLCVAFLGMLFIPLTMALSTLGWRLGMPRQRSE